jgi:hypothetical protein
MAVELFPQGLSVQLKLVPSSRTHDSCTSTLQCLVHTRIASQCYQGRERYGAVGRQAVRYQGRGRYGAVGRQAMRAIALERPEVNSCTCESPARHGASIDTAYGSREWAHRYVTSSGKNPITLALCYLSIYIQSLATLTAVGCAW